MSVDSRSAVEEQVRTTVDETVDATVSWTLAETADGYRISLDDRELEIDHHDGPEEAVHWVLTLRADGETVSKFGPYGSTEELLDQLETVLTSDVFYTVCCDG
jgi:hypothetical protein